MKNIKSILIFGLIIAGVVIIALIYFTASKNPGSQPIANDEQMTFDRCRELNNGVVMESKPMQCLYGDTIYIEGGGSKPAVQNQEVTANYHTYSNPKYKFSFIYPKTLKSGFQDFTYIPTTKGNERIILEKQFIHEIDVEYCSLSGECRPTTQDFSVGVSVIPTSLTALRTRVVTPLTTQTYGKITAYTMSQGAEGEGINYYFISLNANSTLMLDQRYIDESTLISYQSAKNFISYQQQNQIMKDIISSLTFTK